MYLYFSCKWHFCLVFVLYNNHCSGRKFDFQSQVILWNFSRTTPTSLSTATRDRFMPSLHCMHIIIQDDDDNLMEWQKNNIKNIEKNTLTKKENVLN